MVSELGGTAGHRKTSGHEHGMAGDHQGDSPPWALTTGPFRSDPYCMCVLDHSYWSGPFPDHLMTRGQLAQCPEYALDGRPADTRPGPGATEPTPGPPPSPLLVS